MSCGEIYFQPIRSMLLSHDFNDSDITSQEAITVARAAAKQSKPETGQAMIQGCFACVHELLCSVYTLHVSRVKTPMTAHPISDYGNAGKITKYKKYGSCVLAGRR